MMKRKMLKLTSDRKDAIDFPWQWIPYETTE